jgi:hypothetical protein
MKALKPKKCRTCKEPFQPHSTTQRVCSPKCALELAKLDREKAERKKTGLRKVELRSRRDWLKLAQVPCNQFVRMRDDKDPCISCGRHHTGQYHSGHYLSAGACPELRFHEDNIHKQCSACNNHKSGNITLYRINLIKKIGLERVEWLEGPHEPAKWTIDQLKEIRATYLAKVKDLKKQEKDKFDWIPFG